MDPDQTYRDPDWLNARYHDDDMTVQEIADKLGVAWGTVYHWIRKHGIETRQSNPREIPADNILVDIARVSSELGYPCSSNEYKRRGQYSVVTVVNRFGSWNEAKEAATTALDLDDSPHHSIVDRETLLEDVKAVARELDRPPSRDHYDEVGNYSSDTVAKRCGSWMAAKREAAGELGMELEEHIAF